MSRRRIDRFFLGIALLLLTVGAGMFASASLGLLARNGPVYEAVTLKQLGIGIALGLLALVIASRIHYKVWRRLAPFLFFLSCVAMLLVFVHGIGFSYNGASRWIRIGSFTLQPAEFLKIGFILYLASWLSSAKRKRRGMGDTIPVLLLLGIAGALLLKQPDTGTFAVFFLTAVSMYVVSGGWWRSIFALFLAAAIGLCALALLKPYVLERVMTFLDPSRDALGASYQVRQAFLAIGSGQLLGRGFGQSIQKFNFLPEPTGDSIFAIAAEEFGFVGSSVIVLLFLFFALRGLRIAARAPDPFAKLVATGFVMCITIQSFVNIGAMLGVIPLTGVPLLFMSQGGTALIASLFQVGVILNISRHRS